MSEDGRYEPNRYDPDEKIRKAIKYDPGVRDEIIDLVCWVAEMVYWSAKAQRRVRQEEDVRDLPQFLPSERAEIETIVRRITQENP